MKAYEGVFIFPPETAPEPRKTELKNLEDLIAKFKGQIVQKTEWGKKTLGYAIRKFHEGFFLVLDFQMEPAQMPEFRKLLELQEDLLKYTVVAKNIKAEKRASAKAAAASLKSSKSAQTPAPSAAS